MTQIPFVPPAKIGQLAIRKRMPTTLNQSVAFGSHRSQDQNTTA